MKKFLCLSVCFALTAAVLSGCGEDPNAPRDVENQEITYSYGYYDESHEAVYVDVPGTYTGTLVNGVPEGEGTFSADDAEDNLTLVYEGNFENGKSNGTGFLSFTADGETYTEEGTFVDGLYTPTTAEMIASFGQNVGTYGKFNISAAGLDFIKNNESIFPTTSESESAAFVDKSLELRKLKKSTEGFDDRLICLKNSYVAQTFEEFFDGYTITELLLADQDGNYTCIYYPGKIDYYEGDTIDTIYALPLANTSFDNVGGGTTLCLSAFGSYIS